MYIFVDKNLVLDNFLSPNKLDKNIKKNTRDSLNLV